MAKQNNVFYVSFYFLSLTVIAVLAVSSLPVDNGVTKSIIHFNSTNLEVRNIFGRSDPGSFALGGWSIYSNGWFDTNTEWLINLWPPGFMILQGMILKIFGENAPLAGILQILAALTLAIAFNFFRMCLAFYIKNPMYAALIPMILLLSSQFRSFMLGSEAVLLGETFAISFVFIGFFNLMLAYANNNKMLALSAGFCFALSAYFRSQFEMFFMIASLNFLIILIVMLASKKRRYPLIFILVSLLTFHALTIPYKLYNYQRTGSFLWVQTTDLLFRNHFISSAEFEKTLPSFVKGGANLACRIDPVQCDMVGKKLSLTSLQSEELKQELRQRTISTFLHHPIEWISLKIKLLPPFWFSHFTLFYDYAFPYAVNYSFMDNFFNYVFIVCILFSLLQLTLTLKNPLSIINFWLTSSICFAYLAIFLIAHYEARYFLFLKFYFFALALFCTIQMLSTKTKTCYDARKI